MRERRKPGAAGRLGIALPALLAVLLWGSAFPAVKLGYRLFQIDAGDSFAQLLFAGVRFSLAGAMVLCLAAFSPRHKLLPPRRLVPDIILLSLAQTIVQYSLYYISLAHISGSKGSMITSTAVFVSVIAAHFMFKTDRITPPKALGCLAGFAGVALATFSIREAGGFTLRGEGFMFLSAACTGLASPITKRITDKGGDPVTATGWQLFFGGLVLTAAALAGGGRFPTVTPAGLGLLGYMAFLSAAAFTIWSILLGRYSTSRVAVYNFLVPVFGTALSGLVLGEDVLSWRTLAALALVAAGIFLVNRPARAAEKEGG